MNINTTPLGLSILLVLPMSHKPPLLNKLYGRYMAIVTPLELVALTDTICGTGLMRIYLVTIMSFGLAGGIYRQFRTLIPSYLTSSLPTQVGTIPFIPAAIKKFRHRDELITRCMCRSNFVTTFSLAQDLIQISR